MSAHLVPQSADADGGADPGARTAWMADQLITIQDIRTLFGLGRTAAYELTHRSDFPDPVVVSPRCYRWWASEVITYATNLRRERLTRPPRPIPRKVAQRGAADAAPLRIRGHVRAARTRRPTS